MPYLLLGASVLCAVVGDTSLKLADGFKRKGFAVVVAIAYFLSIFLQSVVLESLSLGFVYATWNALQISLVAAVGVVLFREKWNYRKGVGVALIVAGIIAMNLAKEIA